MDNAAISSEKRAESCESIGKRNSKFKLSIQNSRVLRLVVYKIKLIIIMCDDMKE